MQIILQLFRSFPVLIGFSLVFLCFEFIAPVVYTEYIGVFDSKEILTLVFLILYTLVFFFAIPAATSKFFLKEKLKDLGLEFPKKIIITIFLIALSLCILIPYIVFFSEQTQFQSYYSLGKPSVVKFAFINIILLPIYYFAEEFFFRGFLFLGLWRRVGWHSFWMTDVIFTCAHFGKPGLEILLSIPASVVFNFLTLKTKSIYPAVLVHSTMGILMNMLVNFSF